MGIFIEPCLPELLHSLASSDYSGWLAICLPVWICTYVIHSTLEPLFRRIQNSKIVVLYIRSSQTFIPSPSPLLSLLATFSSCLSTSTSVP